MWFSTLSLCLFISFTYSRYSLKQWNWLHSRGLVRTDSEKKRDELETAAKQYYYGAKDTAYSQWTESELKAWLVEHDVIKSDAQVKKEKMQKMVADNYASASDTVYGCEQFILTGCVSGCKVY